MLESKHFEHLEEPELFVSSERAVRLERESKVLYRSQRPFARLARPPNSLAEAARDTGRRTAESEEKMSWPCPSLKSCLGGPEGLWRRRRELGKS